MTAARAVCKLGAEGSARQSTLNVSKTGILLRGNRFVGHNERNKIIMFCCVQQIK